MTALASRPRAAVQWCALVVSAALLIAVALAADPVTPDPARP
jgi:hypothetical protein